LISGKEKGKCCPQVDGKKRKKAKFWIVIREKITRSLKKGSSPRGKKGREKSSGISKRGREKETMPLSEYKGKSSALSSRGEVKGGRRETGRVTRKN